MGRTGFVLARAERWVVIARFIIAAVWTLVATAAVLVIAHAAARGFGWTPDWSVLALSGWSLIATAAVLLALTASIAWAWLGRPDRLAIARMLDDRGNLSEALSTAVWIQQAGDRGIDGDDDRSWSNAAIHHAEGVSSRVEPRALVGVRVPRIWPGLVAAPLLFFAALWIPLGAFTASPTSQSQSEIIQAEQSEDAEQAIEDARAELREALAGSPEAEAVLDALETGELDELRSDPEAFRREAMKKLSEASLNLEEMANNADARSAEMVRDKLSSMRTPAGVQDQDMQRFAKSLQAGNLEAAMDALQKLQERLAAGELSQAEQEALAKAMEQLAEQLEKAAQDHRAMEEALQRAGLDPSLANDPEALEQALQQNSQLSEQQKEQLRQQSQANQQAQQQLNKTAGQCQSCAGGMKAGAQGQQGQSGQQGQQGSSSAASAMAGLQQQLGSMQMAQRRAQQLQAAANSMRARMKSLGSSGGAQGQQQGFEGLFAGEPDPLSMGLRNKNQQPGVRSAPGGGQQGMASGGNGAGGTGAGSSGGAGLADDIAQANNVDLEARMEQTNIGAGPAIGTEFVDSDGVFVQEARTRLAEIVAQQSGNVASEATNETVYPREYHEAIRRYFERLNGAVGNTSNNTESSEDSTG